MAIFQKSVIQKHLNNLDKDQVETAFQKFRENYSPAKIEKIKQLKEEEYQDGFLRDLFVDVFGYTLKPDANYNLVREFKNQADGKKADGAIIDNKGIDPVALAVIELKSTKTKDFKNVTEQAFGYKNNQPECKYVIISNFQKLRFYIDYANEYEEFDLFHLNKEDFELLYLILNRESVFSNLPLKLKEETKFHEQDVSGKLYKDYSVFRSNLFDNLLKNNLAKGTCPLVLDKLTLFNKSQKLLDRFLFVLFAEDSGLLPPNSISRIVKRFEVLKEEDAYKPIYEIFKQYFGYMNVGRKGKSSSDDIPAYNGGLFYPDELLDSLKIDDIILIDDLLRLSEYDFNTEVDVNILGHIFEHSLSEIEEITASIEGTATDKTKSKRKKDGVFYTPKYITQYIVENTIGTLCNEKRRELEIEEIEFDGTYKKKDGTLSAKGKSLFKKLKDYKDWLLLLKIVDPACGSGAFLNQALNFLIHEHKNIDDIIAELTNTALRLFDTDKAILENNLYGVDINEESVEIAKLSLWLRTAQKGRKLSVLSNNIKCGNSLIDDPEVAGDKAFDWNKEFPQIFTKKTKKAWHITTATHNSRYSQRMFDNHVKPGEAVWFSEQDEIIIAKIIVDIVKEDKLNILEYNICGDHMHILLVCDENELPEIVGKIKAMTARAYNIATGKTIPGDGSDSATTRGHVPLSGSPSPDMSEEAEKIEATRGHVPLSGDSTRPSSVEISPDDTNTSSREKKKKYNSLWTQKFGKREITGDNDLQNVINYIRTNRQKHELPENKKLEKIIGEMSCSVGHAFRTEYTGGFDVVIGNPPYVNLEKVKELSRSIEMKGYKTYNKRGDLYCIFVEKGFDILKANGVFSFIMSNKWLQAGYGKNLREYFLTKRLIQLIDFGDLQIFQGATTYPCIFIAQNANPNKDFFVAVLNAANSLDFNSNVLSNTESFCTSEFSGDTWVISSKKENKLLTRFKENNKTLSEYINGNANYGIKFGLTEAFLINEEKKNELVSLDENSSKIIGAILRGRDLTRYGTPNKAKLDNIILASFGSYKYLEKDYPIVFNHLLQYEEKLKKRGQCNGSKETHEKPFMGQHHWLELDNNPSIKYLGLYANPKIMYQTFQVKPCFIYDESGLFCNNSMWIIPTENKALLGVLNSKMGWWLITKFCTQIQNGCQLIWKYFGQIPIPDLSNPQLTASVGQMLNSSGHQQQLSGNFLKYISSQYSINKLSKKLQNWHELDFGEFINELNKANKKAGGEKLSKTDEMDWMEVFETKKAEAQSLKVEIDKTDKEIDQMVYELYGLTEEEIRIVEGS